MGGWDVGGVKPPVVPLLPTPHARYPDTVNQGPGGPIGNVIHSDSCAMDKMQSARRRAVCASPSSVTETGIVAARLPAVGQLVQEIAQHCFYQRLGVAPGATRAFRLAHPGSIPCSQPALCPSCGLRSPKYRQLLLQSDWWKKSVWVTASCRSRGQAGALGVPLGSPVAGGHSQWPERP